MGIDDESIEAAALRCLEAEDVGFRNRCGISCTDRWGVENKPLPGAVLGRLSLLSSESSEEEGRIGRERGRFFGGRTRSAEVATFRGWASF